MRPGLNMRLNMLDSGALRAASPCSVSNQAHAHEAHDEPHLDAHEDGADAHDEPLPDEPKTPLWLTALGGGLFVLLAIGWLAARPAAPTLSELSPPASASAPAAEEP